MEILLFFIDMIRVDRLGIYNTSKTTTLIDEFLENLGGSVYLNCYTPAPPAPDTPRSLACMQTGLYLYFNGCDTRIKWPSFYIKDEIKTIFDFYIENDFNVNFYITKQDYQVGALKCSDNKQLLSIYHDFDRFVPNELLLLLFGGGGIMFCR
jgi:hypothetical protein